MTPLLQRYYVIITLYYHFIISSILRHYYVNITYYYILITSFLRHYYVIITSLLQNYYYLLFVIITLLYVIITSLSRHYYKLRNCVLMSSLLPIITWAISIKVPLIPIITIITYHYVFEIEQLADVRPNHLCWE